MAFYMFSPGHAVAQSKSMESLLCAAFIEKNGKPIIVGDPTNSFDYAIRVEDEKKRIHLVTMICESDQEAQHYHQNFPDARRLGIEKSTGIYAIDEEDFLFDMTVGMHDDIPETMVPYAKEMYIAREKSVNLFTGLKESISNGYANEYNQIHYQEKFLKKLENFQVSKEYNEALMIQESINMSDIPNIIEWSDRLLSEKLNREEKLKWVKEVKCGYGNQGPKF